VLWYAAAPRLRARLLYEQHIRITSNTQMRSRSVKVANRSSRPTVRDGAFFVTTLKETATQK